MLQEDFTEEYYMRQAFGLARNGRGFVSPNPLVGCVVVKDSVLIGAGYHRQYGQAHAEVNAILDAEHNGYDVRGSTVYVNLEPCSHNGKTPPCADLLIQKKIARCVIAMSDPNPKVQGSGINKLRNAGIMVQEGILEEEARELNKFFIKYISTGIPYITIKIAMSLDGKTALKSGQSKWITSEASRTVVHRMRAEYDAVLVTSATVLADDPELTVRLVEGRSPKRIILDANLRVPETAKVYSDLSVAHTVIVINNRIGKEKPDRMKSLRNRGISFIEASAENNQLLLADVFKKTGNMGIASILIEPGPTLSTILLQEQLFDELAIFSAPAILGNDAQPAFSDLHLKRLEDVKRLQLKTCRIVEGSEDIITIYKNTGLPDHR